MYIRRPLPWPRQGRRLGPPDVWNLKPCPTPLKLAVWQLETATKSQRVKVLRLPRLSSAMCSKCCACHA